MPAVTKDEAVALLARAVETEFGPDEVLEIYNELYRDDPATEEAARADPGRLAGRIVADLRRAPPEEVADRWWTILPGYRDIWYDVDDDVIHYRPPRRQRTG